MSRPFPSTIAIVGGIGAGIPFVFQSGSASWRTENGRLVDFVYRDWLAVGAGGVAAVAAVVVLLFFARDETPRRAAAALVGLALLVAGTYSVLRGFGVVSVARPNVATSASSAPELAPPPTARGTVDARALSERIFRKWRADLLDELAADFGWQGQRRDLQRHFDAHHALLGAFTSVSGAEVVAADDDRTRVEGEAVFERGAIGFLIEEVGDDPPSYHLEFTLPPAMAQELEAKATSGSADRAAREMLAMLLAGNVAEVLPRFSLHLIDQMGPDFEPRMREMSQELGENTRFEGRKLLRCGSAPLAYCMEYMIVGRKLGDGWATFELELRVGQWEVVAFAVSSEDP
jgi:hypothetical protein